MALTIGTIALAALGYILATFFVAAMAVRFLPDNYSACQVRKHLILFLVIPFLLIIDLVSTIDAAAAAGSRLLRTAFELASGRRLYRSVNMFYRYPGRKSRDLPLAKGPNGEVPALRQVRRRASY